jgi:carboxymethylenebutenolidase
MEKIKLKTADHAKMLCYVARPASATKGGVIVLQEAFGVNNHIQSLVKRFADVGYVSIAPEIFHRTAEPGFTAPYNDFQKVVPHFSAVTETGIQQDVQACFDWLKGNGCKSVAAIGYCLGGRAAFIANASVPLSAAISYYGGRIVPSFLPLASKQIAPLLFFWGGLDKGIPPDQIQAINSALRESNKPFTSVEISNAEHGFFCDDRPAYNPVASREVWPLTLAFLNENMTAK